MFDEKYYESLLKIQMDNRLKLIKAYLTINVDTVLKKPQDLFLKPVIGSRIILNQKQIELILNFLQDNDIDLNSTVYFSGRGDSLKGADIISGIICFSIFYWIDKKKRNVSDQEIEMLQHFINSAKKNGWKIDNKFKNGKTIKDFVHQLISKKNHKELLPIYELLIMNIQKGEQDKTKSDEDRIAKLLKLTEALDLYTKDQILTVDDLESEYLSYLLKDLWDKDKYPTKKDYINFLGYKVLESKEIKKTASPQKNTKKEIKVVKSRDMELDNVQLNALVQLLSALSINQCLHPSILNNAYLYQNIELFWKKSKYSSISDYLLSLGYKLGSIEGDVEEPATNLLARPVLKQDEDLLASQEITNEKNQETFGVELSIRAFNCLKRFGINTYGDLANIDMQGFRCSRNVGEKTALEVQALRKLVNQEIDNQKKLKANTQIDCALEKNDERGDGLTPFKVQEQALPMTQKSDTNSSEKTLDVEQVYPNNYSTTVHLPDDETQTNSPIDMDNTLYSIMRALSIDSYDGILQINIEDIRQENKINKEMCDELELFQKRLKAELCDVNISSPQESEEKPVVEPSVMPEDLEEKLSDSSQKQYLLKNDLVQLIKDIEKHSKKWHCYAYPKTMRSILTGKKASPFSGYFSDKDYYGVYDNISISELTTVLDQLCDEEVLKKDLSRGKTRYVFVTERANTLKQDSNTEVTNEPKTIDFSLIVEELKEIYQTKSPEDTVEDVFRNNNFEQYLEKIREQSKELFGSDLEDYLTQIGILKHKQSQELDNSDHQLMNESENIPDGDNDDSVESEPSFEAIINDSDKTVESEMNDDNNVKKEMTDGQIQEFNRIMRLVDSIFQNHQVNILSLEGTSLEKRINVLSDELGYSDVTSFFRSNGYSVDDSCMERYKMIFAINGLLDENRHSM